MWIRTVLVTSIVLCAPGAWADEETPPENQTADQAQLAHEQEVGAAIAELRSKLRELHQAYISRLQALRTTANTAGGQTESQRATELIEFDPQMLRLEPQRSLWKSRDGFFERLHEGHWIEKIPNGDAKLLSEAGRTAEYVELSGRTRSCGSTITAAWSASPAKGSRSPSSTTEPGRPNRRRSRSGSPDVRFPWRRRPLLVIRLPSAPRSQSRPGAAPTRVTPPMPCSAA